MGAASKHDYPRTIPSSSSFSHDRSPKWPRKTFSIKTLNACFERNARRSERPVSVLSSRDGVASLLGASHSQPNHRLSEVLSEGEQKVIALSDFLAEAAVRAGSAPILFDDPVTSLDYKRLEYIVDRLYELSAEHQIIVFTHNIWFATTLLARFEKSPDDCSYFSVDLGENGLTGIVTGGSHPRWDTPGK